MHRYSLTFVLYYDIFVWISIIIMYLFRVFACVHYLCLNVLMSQKNVYNLMLFFNNMFDVFCRLTFFMK